MSFYEDCTWQSCNWQTYGPQNSWPIWNLEELIFVEGGRAEKTPRSKDRTNNKLNPHMTSGLRIKPGSHWWEASALTTASSLLPKITFCKQQKLSWQFLYKSVWQVYLTYKFTIMLLAPQVKIQTKINHLCLCITFLSHKDDLTKQSNKEWPEAKEYLLSEKCLPNAQLHQGATKLKS